MWEHQDVPPRTSVSNQYPTHLPQEGGKGGGGTGGETEREGEKQIKDPRKGIVRGTSWIGTIRMSKQPRVL